MEKKDPQSEEDFIVPLPNNEPPECGVSFVSLESSTPAAEIHTCSWLHNRQS